MEQIFLANKEITYTGEQLRSHWIYEESNLLGDTIVSFIGGADVKLDHMVDLLDVKEESPIYSSKMLHFIIEHFSIPLVEMILRQRLFICQIHEYLNSVQSEFVLTRNGDDLYINDKKLSVSIATLSPVSGLIHVGLNIDSAGAPVKAAGLLSEMNIQNIKDLAIKLMTLYTNENKQINHASYKVRPVK